MPAPAEAAVSRLTVAEIARLRRCVFWVEPRGRYADAIAVIRRAGVARFKVFVPDRRHMDLMAQQAAEVGLDLSDAFLPFSTVDASVDEELYASSLGTARWFARRFFEWAPSEGRPEWLERPVAHALADRFAAALRPTFALASLWSRLSPCPVVMLPRADQKRAPFSGGLGSLFSVWEPDGRRPAAKGVSADLFFRTVPSPRPEEVARVVAESEAILVSNLADKQYRFVCEQVLPGMRERAATGLVCVNAAPDGMAAFAGTPIAEIVEAADVPHCFSETGEPFAAAGADADALARCVAALDEARGRTPAPEGTGPVAPLVAEAAAKHFLPILETAARLASASARDLRRLRCVAVSPGRYLPAAVLVEAAKAQGVPTVEIQGGVIARSRRFYPPSAARVLAMDHVSKDIFCGFLGVPDEAVEIVGSPRIDQSVAAVRHLWTEQARDLADLPTGRFVVVVASQPIGPERAAKVVSTVLAGLSGIPGALCVVKMHPNEDQGYEDAYAAAAAARPDVECLVRRQGDAYAHLAAADAVATYFSTMGIEAFVLGKGVLRVDPFGGRVPFDLCALGVAADARTAAEVTAFARKIIESGDPQFYVGEPRLSVFRDGGAKARIVAAVAGAMATEVRT